MKKFICLIFTLLMCITLVACSSKKEEVGMANPMVEYNSLEEINEKANVHLTTLGVMGVSDEKFYVINDEIAEYDFSLNGVSYCFRGLHDGKDIDISGVYANDGKTIFEGSEGKSGYVLDDNNKAFYFLVDGDRYNVVVDGDIELEMLFFTMNEMQKLVVLNYSDPALLKLVGSYQDMTSMRATMEISVIDDDKVKMDIMWSSSANEYDEWIIEAKLEDGKLEYDNDDIIHNSTNQEGTVAVDDSIGGYFEVKDDGIYWTGSGNELTSTSVFAMIVE